jgi:hypothetical protein
MLKSKFIYEEKIAEVKRYKRGEESQISMQKNREYVPNFSQ